MLCKRPRESFIYFANLGNGSIMGCAIKSVGRTVGVDGFQRRRALMTKPPPSVYKGARFFFGISLFVMWSYTARYAFYIMRLEAG